MNDPHPDPELRARFQELRRLDAGRAPSFAGAMARAQAEIDAAPGRAPLGARRVTLRRYRWAGGLAAAAAIAALIMIPRVRSNEDAFVQAVQSFQTDPALGAWRSPTDGLLKLPGNQLISTIPRVGTTQQ
jgi:hypothetical protein